MSPKGFFRRVGHSFEKAGSSLLNAGAKATGGILGASAGKAILSGIASYGPEVAEGAVMALKTGGRVPGGRNKPVHFIGHGSEYILPANAKPTKAQKKVVAKNRAKAKKNCSCHNFV
jgi:hypothetical protein